MTSRRAACRHSVVVAIAIAAAGFAIRTYAAASPVLHPWDERFHAVVAKNLIDNPLRPVLYADPVLPYDYRDWYSNHVWLHKPPLALWLQAASMRVFGVAELPLRLPSIVISTIGILLTFGIGRLLFSPAVGVVAAACHAFNGFLIDLAAGRRASDHVDTLVIVLVEGGILAALIAARRAPAATGVVLGAACGLAYLTKSFSGILLLPIWGAIRWQFAERSRVVGELGVAGVVAAVIAMPWTMYAMRAFPLEWQHENHYAWRHVTEVLETHGGPPWQYVKDMPREFGELIYLPVGVALISVLAGTASRERRAMVLWLAVPYALFSFMATKMPGYVMLAAPAVFLIQAEVWIELQRQRQAATNAWRKTILVAATIALAISPLRALMNPAGPLEPQARPQWVHELVALNPTIGDGKAVVFNVPAPIEAMFYTRYVAYNHMPSAEHIGLLRSRGYRVYVYEHAAGQRTTVRRVDDRAY